ncbi:MAG: 16S rRNA (guanine(966)-N(2))-methyltransferase RsmD [Eubacteriales bacterium]
MKQLRVITGRARGRKLKAPKGMETRPTSDRIKESLFNIIGDRIIDAIFLDLYAGTGAIGIEAISRGAGKSVFVESNLRTIKIIKENLELTGLAEQAEVLCRDVSSAIRMLSKGERKFSIIFLDPPYLKDLVQQTLLKLDENHIIAPGGVIITESSKLDVLPEHVGQLARFRQERYSDTVLSFYRETGM